MRPLPPIDLGRNELIGRNFTRRMSVRIEFADCNCVRSGVSLLLAKTCLWSEIAPVVNSPYSPLEFAPIL